MARPRFPKVSPRSLRALATEIRLELSGGIASDDSRFPIRLIESQIRHMYGLVQKEEDVANELLNIHPDTSRVVPYTCRRIVDADDLNCSCTEYGGKLKKVALPSLLQWRGSPYISFIGNTNMSMSFIEFRDIFTLEAMYKEANKPSYFIMGKNAYIYLPDGFDQICEVTIAGIPADPTDTEGKCFNVWSDDWGIPEYMKAIVKRRVIETQAEILMNTSQGADVRNNAQHGNQFVRMSTP